MKPPIQIPDPWHSPQHWAGSDPRCRACWANGWPCDTGDALRIAQEAEEAHAMTPQLSRGALAAQWCLVSAVILALFTLPLNLFLLLGLYCLPALIANKRRHPQRWAICWLTLLAGWTGMGWVAALCWSVMHLDKHTT
jgi:hypothetical protein